MKNIITTAVALVALSAPAFAGGPNFDRQGSGNIKGSASTLAASAGGSLGNGNSFSEAGQFAGNTGTLTFSQSLTGNGKQGGLTGTVTNESFTSGFDRARSNNSSLAGAMRGGLAGGTGSFWGDVSTDW